MKITKVTPESVSSLMKDLLKRNPNQYTSYSEAVQGILNEVRQGGDKALFEITRKFDKKRSSRPMPTRILP